MSSHSKVNVVENEPNSSFLGGWWRLRNTKNTPLWKVFWLFWFIPSNVVRIIASLICYSVLNALHLEFHHHFLVFTAVLSMVLFPFDLFCLYYVYRARSRSSAVWFGLVALAVSGLYILQDILNLLVLIHPHK